MLSTAYTPSGHEIIRRANVSIDISGALKRQGFSSRKSNSGTITYIFIASPNVICFNHRKQFCHTEHFDIDDMPGDGRKALEFALDYIGGLSAIKGFPIAQELICLPKGVTVN
jgi:hypothetical protein